MRDSQAQALCHLGEVEEFGDSSNIDATRASYIDALATELGRLRQILR